MEKDIILGDELKDSILKGINKLSEAVLATMGPNGNTVIIADGDTPYITKDGVSVSKAVRLNDPIENIGAKLVKEVANRTVDQAGDGTTTSVCLAHAFINKGFELLKQGITYNEIKLALDEIERFTLKNLEELAIPLTDKNLISVATISSNNDDEIGKLIDEAYKHSKIVKVEESNNTEDALEKVTGMKVLGSYYDKAFINNFKKKAIEYNKECKLIIVKGKVNNISEIRTFLEGPQLIPIVIIADDYHNSVISILRENYNKGLLEIGLLKSPGFAQHRKDLIEDILIYTKSSISSNKNIFTGHVNSITATKDSIIFTRTNPNNTNRLSELNDMLGAETESYQKELLEQRIENLQGNLSIIKVGGNSEIEMKERKDRIDDAVLAVKCALEEGTIPGGGHALKQIFNKALYTKTPIIELATCLLAPYETIGITKISNKILDPVKVTRCAFQNAISVSKTILNTKAIVIGNWVWN